MKTSEVRQIIAVGIIVYVLLLNGYIAFEGENGALLFTAHALKGLYANLSLTPLTKPVSELTELLRNRTDTDHSALLAEAKAQFEKLCSLAAE